MGKRKPLLVTLPEGITEIVPDDEKYWHAVFRKVNGLLADYSFMRIDLAPLEHADLFIRACGSGDEGVEKRLVTTRTKDGVTLAQRYQMAPSFMRAYLQHGMHALAQPVKMFATSQIVRHGADGMQSALKLGIQTIGDDNEAVEAELIFLGCRILESLNLGPFTVRMNTIGDSQSRVTYARALREYYRSRGKKLCAKCRSFQRESILMALECTQEECRDVNKDAPQILDHLSEEARAHFKRLLEFLDEGKVPYILEPYLVRHEDYAAKTVFEFVLDGEPDAEGKPTDGKTVIKGGRFDRLSDLIGGSRNLPAAGWSLDVRALVDRLIARNAAVPELGGRPKVFLSQLGEAAKRKSLMLFEEIRKSGIDVRYSLSRDTIKGQLRMAAKLGVRYALIFGQKEALEGTVIVREVETGIQETIPQEKIIDALKKRLKSK
ncbi:MAG TPA: HisS family protein [Candidatus Paceibacterota bacterium]|nr:HisS family protein [Candidatus Paceibacterota bacterium]